MNAKTLTQQTCLAAFSHLAPEVKWSMHYGALDANGTLTARVIRGKKAETKPEFFDEIAAALQSSPDFGENWDALLDCLSDAHWSIAKSLVVCILDGSRLLQMASPDQRQHCRDVFEETARRLNEVGRSFHVIWQTTAPEVRTCIRTGPIWRCWNDAGEGSSGIERFSVRPACRKR